MPFAPRIAGRFGSAFFRDMKAQQRRMPVGVVRKNAFPATHKMSAMLLDTENAANGDGEEISRRRLDLKPSSLGDLTVSLGLDPTCLLIKVV